MSLMGDGLKKVSGNKLEPILYRLSNTMLKGVLLGTGVTAVIQSSCATAVMVVGFVNSGMMKVRQGINVILGAILGTSITGWVVCLSYLEGTGGLTKIISTATLTGIVAFCGIILRMFAKRQTFKNIGDILLGFSVLMTGMSIMSGAVSVLGEQAWFTSALTSMSNPLLGILVGLVFTALLQSASAAVGIVQALSVTGAMSFSTALPLLMGISIGASTPVLLSAIGANVNGRRTAFVYPISATLGVMFTAAAFYISNAIFNFSFMDKIMDPFSLAFINTIMRLILVALLLPFTDVIEATVTNLIKDKNTTKEDRPGIRLEERFISHPALAIEQSRMTINDMAHISGNALNKALSLINKFDEAGFEEVRTMESSVDEYEDSLGTYLVKLTGQEMTAVQNEEISKFLHTLSDFERISDHALNLAENAKEIHEKGVKFSDSALKELSTIREAVSEVVRLAVDAFVKNDLSIAEQVEPLEELIDDLCDEMKHNHINRLQHGECTIVQGFVFNDILTNCERVSDHCSNIAVAMIELGYDLFDTHDYLSKLHEKRSPAFERYYEEYKKRFLI
ncbi:MAG: Na/Pi cotransporter family protein [Lachnospiraceae bacterium]|nr:Na/Pi cotransporter family protein [Lachnospiraceae bacterium]